MSFQEKFKEKLGTIGKQGIIEFKAGSEIVRAAPRKIHDPILVTARSVVVGSTKKKKLTPVRTNEAYCEKPRTVDYIPYTLKDYKVIKPHVYYQLGGLGAYNVGTDEWIAKKNNYDKRKQYGQNVNFSNILKFSDPDEEIMQIRELAVKIKHNFISHRRYASAL